MTRTTPPAKSYRAALAADQDFAGRAPSVRIATRANEDAWLSAPTHVILVTSPQEAREAVRALTLSAAAVRSRVATTVASARLATFADSGRTNNNGSSDGQHSVLLHAFNPESPYTHMRAVGKAVAGIGGDVCVHVRHVPRIYHVPLANVLAKNVYTFQKYKTSRQAKPAPHGLRRTVWLCDRGASAKRLAELTLVVERGIRAADFARDIENEPANRMTPHDFCRHAAALLESASSGPSKLRVTVMGPEDMKREGLNLILAVGQSSDAEPRFFVAEWIKSPKYPTVCLVGKGVTFDAGGLRLKSAPGMLDMKQDKSGAAVAVAVLYDAMTRSKDSTLKGLDVKGLNVIVLAPLVENVINGSAMKPGDVVTAHNGTTVEIMDPDAEGRLILADALSYSARYKPDYILDFATLTNYASTVCCDLAAAFYTRTRELAEVIESLGEATGERVFRHPAWTEYRLHTASPVADARNAHFECTRSGSFMATMFLANFVPPDAFDRWVHFDISNNDVRGIHSGNCALLGMELVQEIARRGRLRK